MSQNPPSSSGSRTLIFIGIIIILIILAAFLFFTLQQTQNDLTAEQDTATQAAATAAANINTLQDEGTSVAQVLSTLEYESTVAADQLGTATDVYNQAQADIETLESDGTLASGQLNTATEVHAQAQETISTLESGGTLAGQQLATATEVHEMALTEAVNLAATSAEIADTATQVFAEAQVTIAALEEAGRVAEEQLATAAGNYEISQTEVANLQATAVQMGVVQGEIRLDASKAHGVALVTGLVADQDAGEVTKVIERIDQIELVYPQLVIDLSQDDSISEREWYEDTYTNFAMGVIVDFGPGAAEDECGFTFRDTDDDDFYTIRVNQDRSVRFVARVDGVWQPGSVGEGNALTPGAGNELILVALDDTFTLYINGQLAATFSDAQLKDGRIGLLAATFENSEATNCTFTNAWGWDLGHIRIGEGGRSGAPIESDTIIAANANQVAFEDRHGQGQVAAAIWSPDGRWIAIPCSIGVWLYDANDLTAPVRLTGVHSRGVRAAAFSPDGTVLATAGEDSKVKLWDVESGDLRDVLNGHTNFVITLAFSPDGELLASGSLDGTLRIWQMPSGAQLNTFDNHQADVTAVAFSDDGLLVSGDTRGKVFIWNLRRRRVDVRLEGHRDTITGLGFFGKTLVSSSEDDTLRVWDVENESEIRVLEGNTSDVLAMSIYANRAVSGGMDDSVRMWDIETGEQLSVNTDATARILGVSFAPDGNRLIAVSSDNQVRILGADLESTPEIITGFTNPINAIAYSVDGLLLATGGSDGRIRVYDGTTFEASFLLEGHQGTVRSIAFSPDGKLLVSGGIDHRVRVWDLADQRELANLEGHNGIVQSVTFSADGTMIASAAADGTVRIWEVACACEVNRLTGHEGSGTAVTFSPDSSLIATGDNLGTIRLWRASSGRIRDILIGHFAAVSSLVFNHDGTMLLSGGRDGTARVWAVEDADQELIIDGLTVNVLSAVYSPDESLVLMTLGDPFGNNNVVMIWSMEDGAIRAVLRGHTNWVYGAVFSSDGKKIISGSVDGTVRLWNLNTDEAFPQNLVETLELVGLDTQRGYLGDYRELEVIDLTGRNTGPFWVAFSGNYDDFVAKVTIEWEGGGDIDECGMYVRFNDSGLYSIRVDQSPALWFLEYSGNDWQDRQEGNSNIHINLGNGGQNELVILAQGDTLRIFINGEEGYSTEDSTHTGGLVTLLGDKYSFVNDDRCIFRDAWVWSLD